MCQTTVFVWLKVKWSVGTIKTSEEYFESQNQMFTSGTFSKVWILGSPYWDLNFCLFVFAVIFWLGLWLPSPAFSQPKSFSFCKLFRCFTTGGQHGQMFLTLSAGLSATVWINHPHFKSKHKNRCVFFFFFFLQILKWNRACLKFQVSLVDLKALCSTPESRKCAVSNDSLI